MQRIILHKHFLSNQKKMFCMFFQNWLQHFVDANMSQEERISLSFNTNLEGT